MPQQWEYVIGIVVKKMGDLYKVDIGTSEPAAMSFLSFENASKKTKQDLSLGI